METTRSRTYRVSISTSAWPLCPTDLPRELARYRNVFAGQQSKLYHMGIKRRVSRSTLADANESRDWRIYADFAQSLIGIARRLYAT